MDKILSDGTVLTKAKFIRTKCKCCNTELPKGMIRNGKKWCDKDCMKRYRKRKSNRKKRR